MKFERSQSYGDAPVHDCPTCGGRVQRIVQAVSVIFKARGFYVTDNNPKGEAKVCR